MRSNKSTLSWLNSVCLNVIVLYIFFLVTLANATTPTNPAAEKISEASKSKIQASFLKAPLYFEANRGQTDKEVKFIARGAGFSMFLTSAEAVMVLGKATGSRQQAIIRDPMTRSEIPNPKSESGPSDQNPKSSVVRMRLVGSSADADVEGRDRLPGMINYFTGKDATQWRTNIPTYGKVKYHGVYKGVDLVYYGNQGKLESDFIVAPGADPGNIKIAFDGVNNLRADSNGDLILQSASGDLRMYKPLVYQTVDGVKKEIAGSYVLNPRSKTGTELSGNIKNPSSTSVGFQVAAYDSGLPLVIDPVLVFSTYLGGSGGDMGLGVATDAQGNVYVAGETHSANFPTAGAFQNSSGGAGDAFVTKLNPTGTALVYATFLGGSFNDSAAAIAVDSAGNAYVAGFTLSPDFPTANAFQQTCGACPGHSNAFLTKLNPTGTGLVYSTYLGGADIGQEPSNAFGFGPFGDSAAGIAVDNGGNAYVAGRTTSSDFPTTPGAFQTSLHFFPLQNIRDDGFVTKFGPTGALVYSTYLGGDFADAASGIAVDTAGQAYVAGTTDANDFPVTVTAFQLFRNGAPDAFMTVLNAGGSGLIYSTRLGGSGFDFGEAITIDAAGMAYVAGQSSSAGAPFPFSFPTKSAVQPNSAGGFDAFVAKIDPSQAGDDSLVYSTYLGGSGSDGGVGIAVDGNGKAFVTGGTNSTNFPTVAPIQTTIGGLSDAFVAKLNPSGTGLVYSTYLGGHGNDGGAGVVVDSAGDAYVVGVTGSTDFPTAPGAFQTVYGGGSTDAFVAKIQSVTQADVFLHASGSTLFLDSNAPTATTEQFKDSASIKFAGGNLWKEIGTWTAAPAGSPQTFPAASDLHGWLGLINSNDIGTRFDLRAEIYRNGTMIAAGETFCITGVTRNPSLAKEVLVSIGLILDGAFAATDVLSLKMLTRIGTTGGAFCGGHGNAVGLRLYFDAVNRPSHFAGPLVLD